MPYKSDNIIIENTSHDRRIKLNSEDKKEIIRLRKEFNYSQRQLARMFKVSRRTIQFILDPEKLKENLKRREERGGWKQYYDKDIHKEYIKNHRNYKHNLYLKEKIYVF